MTISLEAMLRRASRIAEQMFDKDGEIDSFWLVETVTGEQRTIVTPMCFPPWVSADEAKRELAAKLRELFKEIDVARYAHAAEAWMAREDDHQGPVVAHPRRQEIVVIHADDGSECLVTMRDIIRPPGGKPYLAKMAAIERTEQPEGRLMNLLNDVRPGSELADGEGTLFMTSVPGAPFQVVGRRGPTGELFADMVIRPQGEDAPIPSEQEARAHGIEVVTGPEAERLIAGVKRRMGAPAQ
jgi:hypothetical protein